MADSGLNEIKNRLRNVSIHVIPYCHADYAWTHPRSWHIKRYRQIINEVLDIMSENSSYTWMTDNIMHMLKPYFEDPSSRITELAARINEGRIEITNSMMSLLRPTTAGQETFIRNFVLGQEWMRKNGIACNSGVFHNVDVSIGHSQLPQLLRLAGFSYYRGWRPQGALDAKTIPRQFIWKGLDGSEIVCSRGTYAGIWRTDYLDRESFSDDDGTLIEFFEKELDDIITISDTNTVWLPFGMDDTLPMRDFNDVPVNLDLFMKYLRETADADIGYSTADRYFKSIPVDRLDMHEGILDPCDVAYNIPTKGDKGLWLYRSLLESLITKAETLWVMAGLHGADYPIARFREAWENQLFISGHAMEYTLYEDYDAIYRTAVRTQENIMEITNDALAVIRESHGFMSGRHLLINTLEYERCGVFSIFINDKINDGLRVVDIGGNPVDYQIVGDSEVLVDVSIPGFGISILDTDNNGNNLPDTTETIQKDDHVVSSSLLEVSFREGFISNVNGWQFDGSSIFGQLCYTEIESSSIDSWLHNNEHGDHYGFIPCKWKLIENGPLRWVYRTTGFVGPAKAEIYITICKGSQLIGFDIVLECTKKSNGFFSVSFPANEKPSIRAGIPFGYETRNMADEPFGKQTDIDIDNLERLWPGLFYGNGWISFRYEDTEFSILGERLPSYFHHDSKSQSISAILTRTFNLSSCTDWMKDTHPYNECIGKSHFKFSVMVNDRFSFPDICKCYRNLRNMPEHVMHSGGEYGINEYEPVFDIDSDYCMMSAMYMEAGKVLLRMFNTAGTEDTLVIHTTVKIKGCFPVGLTGTPMDISDSLICSEFSVHTKLKGHQILTLAFDFYKDSD